MIHSDDLPKAAQFEAIILPDADVFYTTRLYAVEGKPGIWSRTIKADAEKDGATTARFNGGTIYLVRNQAIEAELKEAGFHLPPLDEGGVEGDQAVPCDLNTLEPRHTRRLQGAVS